MHWSYFEVGHFSKLGAYYFFSFSEIHFQYVGLHNFMPSIYDFLREGGGGGEWKFISFFGHQAGR